MSIDPSAVLRQARAKLTQQAAALKRLTAEKLVYATVLRTAAEYRPSLNLALEPGTEVIVTQGKHAGARGVIEPSRRHLDDLVVLQLEGVDRPVMADISDVEAAPTWYRYAVVALGGHVLEVELPLGLEVQVGDRVSLTPTTNQVVALVEMPPAGPLASVSRVTAEGLVVVSCRGEELMVGVSEVPQEGDEVVLDATSTVITANLGSPNIVSDYAIETAVSWDDIGGLDRAKAVLREIIELPLTHADLFRHYHRQPVKGILLYGPPGCGKTLLGKAAATAMARLHGVEGSRGFLYHKGPDLLNRYVGETERAIRERFAWARRFRQEHDYPALLFFDEADALMGRRGSGVSSDIDRTIVPTLLTELDGLEESEAVVMLATNRPDVLDPAIVREGRIDRKVWVERPTQTVATDIFQIHLRDCPLSPDTPPNLAAAAAEELYAPRHILYDLTLQRGMVLHFTLAQAVTGGMIAGVVDRAKAVAMERDLLAGNITGVSLADIVRAVREILAEAAHLDHSDALNEFAADFRSDVTNIRRHPSL